VFLISTHTELKTDLAVQYVQQAKQVEALIDNLPEKQDVGPIVSDLMIRYRPPQKPDTLLYRLIPHLGPVRTIV
jgi:hypothetical protein